MAKKGLSKLVCAKYNANENTVTYTDPTIQEKLAEYSAEIESLEQNNLYLDNDIAESDGGTFNTGTLSLTTGDLSNETSKLFFKLKENEVAYSDGKTVKELAYDDTVTIQDLGVGVIEMHQVNKKTFYRAIWFTKVNFNIPSSSATTKGETIEWQTQEITGTIMRSADVNENGIHPWRFTADFDTEEDALEYLMFKGGKTATSASK